MTHEHVYNSESPVEKDRFDKICHELRVIQDDDVYQLTCSQLLLVFDKSDDISIDVAPEDEMNVLLQRLAYEGRGLLSVCDIDNIEVVKTLLADLFEYELVRGNTYRIKSEHVPIHVTGEPDITVPATISAIFAGIAYVRSDEFSYSLETADTELICIKIANKDSSLSYLPIGEIMDIAECSFTQEIAERRNRYALDADYVDGQTLERFITDSQSPEAIAGSWGSAKGIDR